MDFSHLYYKPGGEASFSSLERLYKAATKENPLVKRQDVRQYLEKQYTFSRHKRIKKHFPRRKILVLRIDDTWASDLIQVDSLANYNAGKCYILNCIDLFSRKMWARGIKTKAPSEVQQALKSIFEENGKSPNKLWTDR